MSQTKVEAPFVENNLHFKNLLINGDFAIAQRATAATAAGNGTYTTVDRMKTYLGNTSGAYTTAQTALSAADQATTGQVFALDIQCTTADTSVASNAYVMVRQHIEAQNCQHLLYGSSAAKTLTLSFYVKSNLTGTTTGCIIKNDSTAQSFLFEYTINSANTWEKKVIKVTPPTNGGTINNDNGEGLIVQWNLHIGSAYLGGSNLTWDETNSYYGTTNTLNVLSSTDNDLFIAGMQLEVGDVASEFEHLPFDVQLTRCCRYYWRPVQGNASTSEYVGLGDFYSSTQVDTDFRHITPMRTQPTLDQGTGTDYYKYYYGQTADGTVDGAWTYWIGNEHISSIYATASDAVGTSNAGKACRIIAQTTGGANAYIALNAEL
jgi:hypothetical protein